MPLPSSLNVIVCQSGEVVLLASNSGCQNQCFFVWLIELQLWHGLCSRAFVPGIRSDLNEIIRRVDQALIGSLSRAYQIFFIWPYKVINGYDCLDKFDCLEKDK